MLQERETNQEEHATVAHPIVIPNCEMEGGDSESITPGNDS